MAEPGERSPLDTLVLRTPPDDARAFFTGAVSIRQVLESHSESWLGLPLRGAMPMFWAADGLTNVEAPAVLEDMLVEIPVGTYHYHNADKPGVRSPSKRAKVGIIATALSEAGVGEGDTLTLLDEIQGGGTVTQLVRGSLDYARSHGLSLPLHLIAAEDTNVAAEHRIGSYRRISTNQKDGIAATVVRIPLIGCDRDNLLDKVEYCGEDRLAEEGNGDFVVRRNTEAEFLFRSLGSLTRHEGLRTDDNFLRAAFDPLLVPNTETSAKFEEWITKVLALENPSSPQPSS